MLTIVQKTDYGRVFSSGPGNITWKIGDGPICTKVMLDDIAYIYADGEELKHIGAKCAVPIFSFRNLSVKKYFYGDIACTMLLNSGWFF